MRALLIGLVLFAFPSVAAAAPFGELPFRATGGAAACLTPTGKGNEVVRWVRGGVEVLDARPDGLQVTGRVALGRYATCPSVAADPNGAAVLAVALLDEREFELRGLRVVLREPGAAAWSAPVTLPVKRFQGVKVAVSPRGDAVIAWIEYQEDADDYRTRVRAIRRAPGGSFGAVETLSAPGDAFDEGLEVGMSAAGEAIVASSASQLGSVTDVVVRTGAPGAPFGAPQTLVSAGEDRTLALAVAPDGRALVALRDQIFERPPGGAFAPGQPLDLGSGPLRIALRADGAAVIAAAESWQVPAVAVTRSAPGPFGPRVEVAPARPWESKTLPSASAAAWTTNPPIEAYPDVRLTLGADGRALLVRPTDEHDERDQRGLQVVTFSAAAPLTASRIAPSLPAVERATFGGTIRDAWGFSPLVLPDGRFAVAWSDDRERFAGGPYDGRLHLAVEGVAAAPEATAPTVTVGKPNRRMLRPAQPLLLPVRCSAACDVLVEVRGQPPGAGVTGSLTRAGTMTLRLKPSNPGLAPRHGRMRITLHSSAPAARTVQRRGVSLAVRGLPAPSLPRILDLRARRSGGDLLVRWRIDRPLVDASLFVIGSRVRNIDDDEDAIVVSPRRVGGRTYTARLKAARRVRHVRVYVVSQIPSRQRFARLSVPLT